MKVLVNVNGHKQNKLCFFKKKLHTLIIFPCKCILVYVILIMIGLDISQEWDFPGGKVPFTTKIKFTDDSSKDRIPCYRILDNCGQQIRSSTSEMVIVLLWIAQVIYLIWNHCDRFISYFVYHGVKIFFSRHFWHLMNMIFYNLNIEELTNILLSWYLIR